MRTWLILVLGVVGAMFVPLGGSSPPIHTVVRGDTLGEIAAARGVSVADDDDDDDDSSVAGPDDDDSSVVPPEEAGPPPVFVPGDDERSCQVEGCSVRWHGSEFTGLLLLFGVARWRRYPSPKAPSTATTSSSIAASSCARPRNAASNADGAA